MRNGRPCCLAMLAVSLLAAPPIAAGEERAQEPRGAQPPGEAAKKGAPGGDEEKKGAPAGDLLYALGAILGQKIAGYGFTAAERARVQAGFADAAAKKKLRLEDPDLEEWGVRVDQMLGKRVNPKVAATREQGRTFAEAAAREPDAARLPSGAVLRTLQAGTGKSPAATSRVKVSYVGKLIDGTQFDSSAAHGGPAQFPLNGVIPCWTEAVQRMKQGGKARLVCPPSVAYGDQGRPPSIPGGATLVFEIELLSVD